MDRQIIMFIIFPGITGEVIIDANGDRVASYSLLDMDPVSGQFQVSAAFLFIY